MWMWRHDRSWAENFLSTWTPLLLAAMAVTSLLLRYVRDPISCHYVYPQANDYFTDDCFRQTSVLMRSEEFVQYAAQVWQSQRGILPPRGSEAEKPFRTWPRQRTWHQWVPLALGLLALLSLLPHLLGRLLGGLLWLDGDTLLRTLALGPGHVTLVKDSALAVRAGLARGGNWGLSAAALARKGVACGACVLQLALIVGWFRPPLVAAATGGGGEEERRNLTGVNVTVPEVLEDVPLPVTPFFCTVEFTHNARAQTLTMQCLLPLNQRLATHLEAVKTCEELVVMALMGEEWARISARGAMVSTDHSFSIPPRQALSRVLLPGRKSRAHTQSLWAELMDCPQTPAPWDHTF